MVICAEETTVAAAHESADYLQHDIEWHSLATLVECVWI